MTASSTIARQTRATRWGTARIAVETATFAMLLAPPIWLAFNWPWIPAVSPHTHHPRLYLWTMPAYSLAVYVLLSEFGLLTRMASLRSGSRLSRLRPTFLAYFLTTRLELMIFLGGLSFAMDRTALTGHWWPAKGYIGTSLMIIILTIAAFIVASARAGYRLSRPAS